MPGSWAQFFKNQVDTGEEAKKQAQHKITKQRSGTRFARSVRKEKEVSERRTAAKKHALFEEDEPQGQRNDLP